MQYSIAQLPWFALNYKYFKHDSWTSNLQNILNLKTDKSEYVSTFYFWTDFKRSLENFSTCWRCLMNSILKYTVNPHLVFFWQKNPCNDAKNTNCYSISLLLHIHSNFNPQICSSVDTCKLKSKTKKSWNLICMCMNCIWKRKT